MRRLLTVGLLGLALVVVSASRAKADGFGYCYQSSGHISFNFKFSPCCGDSNPYGSCAYAPYFQNGWPTSMPVYPGVAPGFGFAPTPYILPPTPYIVDPTCLTGRGCAPAYWKPR
jgi:hypothetical protein